MEELLNEMLEEMKKQTEILNDISSYISELQIPDNDHSSDIRKLASKLDNIQQTLGSIESNTDRIQ